MKHNRQKLKTEYMGWSGNENDESGLSVMEFFRTKQMVSGKKADGNINKQTKGRQNEKRERYEKASNEAIKKAQKELKKKYEITMEDLLGIKSNSFDLIKKRIKQLQEQDNISVKDLETIVKLAKTELGEPTNITKSENTDTIKVDEELTEEEEEFIMNFKSNANANKEGQD